MLSSYASKHHRPRARNRLVVSAALIVVAGALTVPQRAKADTAYQHLPTSSPATWSYTDTLSTLRQRSAAATAESNAAAATSAAADKTYAEAKTALSDAQSNDQEATDAEIEAKTTLDNARSNSERASAQTAYNKAVGARHAADAAVKSDTILVSQGYVSAKTAQTLATRALAAATLAETRVSRLQYMYGSSPTTAFTKLMATYTFSGNGHRPDSEVWTDYDTTHTTQPHARDPRYIGVYKNNLEATSWGTIGSGTCLCAGPALPTTPYGRWEVRAKVNRNADHGVAILLWPNVRSGPQSGEIDLAEFDQDRTQANFALHYDEKNLQVQSHILGDYRTWHTYRVDWNSRGIAWYIDNNLFATVTDPAAIPTAPFHLVIQAGPNSSKASKTSTTITVSSVKVYAAA